MIVAVIFTAIFFDFEPTKSFPLRKVAQKVATMLGKLIEANVKTVTATSFASTFIDDFRENHNALADCKFSPRQASAGSQRSSLTSCQDLSLFLSVLSLLFWLLLSL